MRRILLLAVCLLALRSLPVGVPAAVSQTTSPERPGMASRDTLTITLPEAHRRAIAGNPHFLAEGQELEIARGQLTRARVYPFNPELEFRAPGLDTRGAIGAYEASLSQEIEWVGQRGLRISAARSGLARAESLVQDAARRTLADVSYAFYAALAAEQRLGVARELVMLNEQLVAVTRIQAREGEISVMDANLAEIEAGRARAALLASERELASANLELGHLIGIDPQQAVTLRDELSEPPLASALDPDSLIALALVSRPDLAGQTRAMEQQEVLLRLARREAIPNLRVGVFLEREASNTASFGGSPGPSVDRHLEAPRLGVGVSLALPLFQRNQGVIEQHAAQVDQARLARLATELSVRTQVADAYQAYSAASEETRVFERDVLQPARANQQLLETALRAGKVGLPTLLLLRNQLLDAELSYWDAWLEKRRALLALSVATATLGTDLFPNPEEVR